MRLPSELALIRRADQADLHRLATDVPAHEASRKAVAKGVIRIGVAREVGSLLREFGADPGEVIRHAGLDPELFDDENNVIPYAALGRVLTACVAHTHCPHFGLLVGQRGTLSSLGPIGGLLQHSPTVGDALSALVRHLHLHDSGGAPTLSAYGDVVTLGYAIYEPGVESPEQIADCAMAVATNVLRTLCGPDWVPDEVLLPRHPPADLGPYRRVFRAPVRFDQETAALVFPTRWLDHRIADANPIFRQVFEAHVRELEAAGAGELEGDPAPRAANRDPDEPVLGHDGRGSLCHPSPHLEPASASRGCGLPEPCRRDAVRDRTPVVEPDQDPAQRGCRGARLFRGERLHAGLPALVGAIAGGLALGAWAGSARMVGARAGIIMTMIRAMDDGVSLASWGASGPGHGSRARPRETARTSAGRPA